MVICCCLLLESCVGKLFKCFFKFIDCKILVEFNVFVMICEVNLIFFFVVKFGIKL